MKRMESKKSHSWWWDSHISPKNSKWLQENLEEMDQRVKQMLKLIEEDADSFAKKAEMYYQKRPELISLVEEFYRRYRSLAERYDHVTGELRKNIPSDLQSQGSGISDVGSEPPSTLPSPDRRASRCKSGPRAAGFDFFLGSGGGIGSDLYNKEGDESSTLDSESESDDSSVKNYSGMNNNDEEQGLRQKIIELEIELREAKEKLQMQEKEISEVSFRNFVVGNSESADKIAKYEEELRVAKDKIQLAEEENNCLKIEIQKCKSLRDTDDLLSGGGVSQHDPIVLYSSIDASEAGMLDLVHKIQTLQEELGTTQEKLHESEEEVTILRQKLATEGSSVQNLHDQVKSARDELSDRKNMFEKEKGEVSKLQDRVARYKINLADRDQEIRGLKETISNANKNLIEENEQLQAEITRLAKERAYLEDNVKELGLRCKSLEEDMRQVNTIRAEKEVLFGSQIEQLKAEIAEKNACIEELKKKLDALQLKYDMLVSERDDLNISISEFARDMSFKDDHIDQMSRHLHQLHMEHVDLIAGAEGARKLAEELRSRIKELEREVEKKQEIIVQGAEEKREAIRQLCFSLEHYRNGYHRLREVVTGHKPVMAT